MSRAIIDILIINKIYKDRKDMTSLRTVDTGFETLELWLHLQWHADTTDDPLLGGSVIRVYVRNIQPIFEEFLIRGTVTKEKFRTQTPWNTNEFGLHDLNNNAIFIMEDANEQHSQAT